MSLKFDCIGIMLRLVCFAHLMMLLSTTKAEVSLSGPTGTILNDDSWTVLKEEIITPLNNTALQANESSSDSPKYVQKTVLDNTKHTHPEIHNDTSEKDQSLFTCKNITLKLGEYDIYDNGTLHVKAFRMTLNSSFYIENVDNTVLICKPTRGEKKPISTLGKVILSFLTFAYTLITMLSAMCSFSKNSTYLNLALASWICVSSNILLWVIALVIIPGPQSVFKWVSISVNMNQSVYLTSAWMALLTSNKALKFLQTYEFIRISKRVVTVRVYWIGALCVIFAAIVASVNFMFDKMDFFNDDELIDCLFCNPIIYLIICVMIFVEGFLTPFQKNLTDVSRDYRDYHFSLCLFSIFNFFCIALGTIAVTYEWHSSLWVYTLFNFLWPLFFVKHIIPRVQTLIAVATEEDEVDQKIPKIPISFEEKVPLKKEKDLEI